MTEWGDYTPGPWRDSGWDNFGEDFEPCRVVNLPLSATDKSFLVMVHGESASAQTWPEAEQDKRVKANARLIAKAYLIPRLEGRLIDILASTVLVEVLDHSGYPNWLRWKSDVESILEELRSS